LGVAAVRSRQRRAKTRIRWRGDATAQRDLEPERVISTDILSSLILLVVTDEMITRLGVRESRRQLWIVPAGVAFSGAVDGQKDVELATIGSHQMMVALFRRHGLRIGRAAPRR
jgi:hypothetical protein